jgi:hypothetical protein
MVSKGETIRITLRGIPVAKLVPSEDGETQGSEKAGSRNPTGSKPGSTEAILDSLANGAEAITPAIWPLEPANALLVGERRKRVSMAQFRSLLRHIGALPISVDPGRVDHAFEPVLWFTQQQQLTEYEAAYLKLALRARASPLATLDNRISALKRAARNAGIAVVKI